MTTFGADRDAVARRRARRDEARRRVDSGEVTATPEAPQKAKRASRAGSVTVRKPAQPKVDPQATPGGRYGIWRSAQHFCVADSIPDAESEDLTTLIRWADSIMVFRLRQRLVARLDSGDVWQPVCYVKDARRQDITTAQAEKYRDCRLGIAESSAGAQKPLKDTDHPTVTESL